MILVIVGISLQNEDTTRIKYFWEYHNYIVTYKKYKIVFGIEKTGIIIFQTLLY